MRQGNPERSEELVKMADSPVYKVVLNRIVYIGNEIPESLAEDDRPKFVLLGIPQEFIEEVEAAYGRS
jgi:hypothetical protein